MKKLRGEMIKMLTLSFGILFFAFTTFAQVYYPTDAGSKVNFVIKNFGLKTKGIFTGLKGIIEFNPQALSTSKFTVTVNAMSVNTDNTSRDKHLRKDEYFNVQKYPLISFVSNKISASTVKGRFIVNGYLTIKGVTKQLQFEFNATPSATGYFFNAEFEINRRDYGVGGSSVSLSDNLKVILEIAANK